MTTRTTRRVLCSAAILATASVALDLSASKGVDGIGDYMNEAANNRVAADAALVQAAQAAVAQGAQRTGAYTDYHQIKIATTTQHVCNAACYQYVFPNTVPKSTGSTATIPAFPNNVTYAGSSKQELIAAGVNGVLGMLLNNNSNDQEVSETTVSTEDWREKRRQEREHAEQNRRQLEAEQEGVRREAEATRLRQELAKARESAQAVSDGIELGYAVAFEGQGNAMLAKMVNYAPVVKSSVDAVISVAGELSGGAIKVVTSSYKAVQDGFDVFSEGQKGSVSGMALETGSMVVNAGKAADALSGDLKGPLSVLGNGVKAGQMLENAAEGEWLKALDKGYDLGSDLLQVPKLDKAIKEGVTGAVKVANELDKADVRSEDLQSTQTQVENAAKKNADKWRQVVAEKNQKADALEQALRDLESGKPAPAVNSSGGTMNPPRPQ